VEPAVRQQAVRRSGILMHPTSLPDASASETSDRGPIALRISCTPAGNGSGRSCPRSAGQGQLAVHVLLEHGREPFVDQPESLAQAGLLTRMSSAAYHPPRRR